MTNPLQRLGALGQSVWYDNISRDLLNSGTLKKMIEEDGVTGVTSNPTIFEKAIGNQKAYDLDLHELVDVGKSVYGIYEGLAIPDIQQAADELRPVYDRTERADGFVSLEVSPALAYDKPGTVEQVRRLHALVDRENLMIKVPATPQGIEAIEDLIGEGININVTLIFSLQQYRATAEAYIEGTRKWIDSGGDARNVSSVASFFVSRVDGMIDDRLAHLGDPRGLSESKDLLGKAAIANAKQAYALYKELFHGETFAPLKEKGARPQRVLWASTSTKNPAYPDTYYVEALAGPETVNTLPTATLDAYRDHGEPASRLEEGLDEAREVFPRLEELGIKVDLVMELLLENGVKAFADSFEKLLDGIAMKRTRLLRGWGHRSACLGPLQKRVDETLMQYDKEKVTEKIWACDGSAWTDDPEVSAEIAHRLGWLNVVETMLGETGRMKEFADEIRSQGFTHAILLGMGGSSLTAEVFHTCLGSAEGYLDMKVLDTTVPDSILEASRGLDLAKTLFIVSSKSGGTIEVLSLYRYFWNEVEKIRGESTGENFIAITDPGTALGKLASEKGFRKVFLNPPDIGGRFSALSYFGLVPAALMGLDIDRILMRASQAVEAAGPGVPALENPGLWLGVILGQATLAGKDKMTMLMSKGVASFGLWLEQMLAESTGKSGKGVVPVNEEPVGATENYGDDRLFVYLRLDDDGTHDDFVSRLEKAGHQVVTLRLHTPYDLGREIFRWEFATAVTGKILNINPFDQPNVQEAKDFTNEILDRYASEGELPEGDLLTAEDPRLPTELHRLLDSANKGDYLAFNAFVHPSSSATDALQSMRARLRDTFKITTAMGFGPRYLHSTGQIHKGGGDNGLFIVITADDREDVLVPGQPYSFGMLKSAQSLGDFEALKKRNRRVLRVHLRTESDLEVLTKAIADLK